MKEIVKEAFLEGRETKTKWGDSDSFELDQKIKNSSFNGRKVVQTALDGKVLNVFEDFRMVMHYMRHVLGKQGSSNMRFAILSGSKCYGFNWGLLESNSPRKPTYTHTTTVKTRVINSKGVSKVFDRYSDAENYIDISRGTIHKMVREKDLDPINGFIVMRELDFDGRRNYLKTFDNPSEINRNKWVKVSNTKNNNINYYKTQHETQKALQVSRYELKKGMNSDALVANKYQIEVIYRGETS